MLRFLPLHSQMFVDIRDAIIAGSTGRMAMILLIYMGPFLRLPKIDVVGLLGSLAASSKESAPSLHPVQDREIALDPLCYSGHLWRRRLALDRLSAAA